MDEAFFLKYKKEIKKQTLKKQEVVEFIKKKTNITITEQEFEIEKQKITFYTPSTKKSALHKKQIKELLKEIGYTTN